MTVDERPVTSFASAAAWRTWLAKNHKKSDGVWLQIAKKASAATSVSYSDAVDVALCYGWIDGQKRKLDDDSWLQRFCPRTARSKWSKLNRDRVARLIDGGAMRAPGLAEVERARADGRWDNAYDAPSTAVVPDDLQRALDQRPKAKKIFATLDSRNRYAILYRVQDAVKPETRMRRIDKYVAMLEAGEKIYP